MVEIEFIDPQIDRNMPDDVSNNNAKKYMILGLKVNGKPIEIKQKKRFSVYDIIVAANVQNNKLGFTKVQFGQKLQEHPIWKEFRKKKKNLIYFFRTLATLSNPCKKKKKETLIKEKKKEWERPNAKKEPKEEKKDVVENKKRKEIDENKNDDGEGEVAEQDKQPMKKQKVQENTPTVKETSPTPKKKEEEEVKEKENENTPQVAQKRPPVAQKRPPVPKKRPFQLNNRNVTMPPKPPVDIAYYIEVANFLTKDNMTIESMIDHYKHLLKLVQDYGVKNFKEFEEERNGYIKQIGMKDEEMKHQMRVQNQKSKETRDALIKTYNQTIKDLQSSKQLKQLSDTNTEELYKELEKEKEKNDSLEHKLLQKDKEIKTLKDNHAKELKQKAEAHMQLLKNNNNNNNKPLTSDVQSLGQLQLINLAKVEQLKKIADEFCVTTNAIYNDMKIDTIQNPIVQQLNPMSNININNGLNLDNNTFTVFRNEADTPQQQQQPPSNITTVTTNIVPSSNPKQSDNGYKVTIGNFDRIAYKSPPQSPNKKN